MKKIVNESEEEKSILDRARARDICQVVMEYGVSQKQIYHMIYLLSLELEKVEDMKKITKLIKGLQEAKSENNNSGIIT